MLKAPHIYRSLRAFCLGAFSVFTAELDAGAEVPFAFEEHASLDRPALYEYRPLVRGFVEARIERLARRDDVRAAIEDLRSEPAARIYARARVTGTHGVGDDEALYRTVLVPLLVAVAEACGGFDWDDGAFDRVYRGLEASLFGSGHTYAAVAPLVGVSAGAQVDLGEGIRVRAAATGELAAHWPEANGLLPADFGRETDRLCVLELERSLPAGTAEPPDAAAELADAVAALRLATAGPIAAGPVIFERLDWQPYGIRPVLPIAATQPPGEPTRLDRFRGEVAEKLRGRLALADDDTRLGAALDRWELSLFQSEPFRGEQLRASLTAALGGEDGLWAASVRAAILLGESGRERTDLLDELRWWGDGAADVLRRALVRVLLHGNRGGLLAMLDESILGLRPRPSLESHGIGTVRQRGVA
jgi:hypothetical protein